MIIHVFDIAFVKQHVRVAVAVQFQTRAVIPFDHALQHLTVLQFDDHRRFRLHLLDVVEILGVGLVRGYLALLGGRSLAGRGVALFLEFVERGTD